MKNITFIVMFSDRIHQQIFFFAIIFLVVSLPFSVFTLSVAQIILVVNWIAEGKYQKKLEIIRTSPALWIIGLFYLVHLLWMIHTSDFSFGLHELRLKLPMLVLPFVVATSASLTTSQLKGIMISFIAGVFSFTLYSSFLIFGFDGKSFHTMTELSPIIWHIRFALMVVLSIFLLFWLVRNESNKKLRLVFFLFFIWLIVFLFLFKSLTGIAVFIVTAVVVLTGNLILNKKTRKYSFIVLFSLLLIIGAYFTSVYQRFFNFEKINFTKLDLITSKGNPYFHDTTKRYVENGYYIYTYICEPELRQEWSRRSNLNFDGRTENNLLVRDCLIRYLTSKGLRKDGEGIGQLKDREIRYIETGKTNYIDTNKYALYPRIYVSLWELYSYSQGESPVGYSLSQRIECLKTAWHIIQKNFWFGIGTGDIPKSFKEQFESDHSPLAGTGDWRSNNQLITFWVDFGILGFLMVMFSLIVPPFFERKSADYLFMVVLIIGFLSFLDEDTFETHPGISMFAIFYSLFLFRKNEKA